MIKPSGIRVVALFALLALCPIKSATQGSNEYVVTVGNEELRFVAQPEAGYVVKAREKTGGISALSSTLSLLLTENAKPIRGLCRRGICVVERQRPAGENEKTVRMLRANSQVEYIAPLFSSNGETVAIIPEIVVRVTPEICHGRTGELQALCQTINLAIKKRMEFTDCEYLLAVQGSDASALFAALEQLNSIDWIEWAAPNVAFQPRLCGQVMPNDERFPLQWHLHNTGQSGGTPDADINAPEAWEITTGDPNIIVAVLDAGIDPNHPDLINNLVAGYDFYEDDDSPDPALDHVLNAHGTMCAGLIAAQGNNEIGVTGVTWNCGIMSIRIDCHGSDGTYYGITEADRATAFRWAADHGAHVLSISWMYSSPTPILHSAIMDITKRGGIGRDGKGCVVVAGVGNDSGPVGWPAKYPEVIAVGATDHDDIRWDYSNYGPELDIVAPSGNHNPPPPHCYLWTTDISGPAGGITHPAYSYKHILDYVHFGGTSGACPVAAGVAALVLSVEPELSTDDVKHFLEQSGKDLGYPGRDDLYGWGRVDARAALDMVLAKRADLNNDWKVGLKDLLILIEFWGTNESSADIAPATRRDGIVDVQDLDLVMQYWQTEIPEHGLIARWKLDEIEGNIACEAAQKRDGTLHGDPMWQPISGKLGGALQLDGIDDYVSTPFVLNPADGPFSVFAWVEGGAPGQVIISQTGIPSGANWLCAGPPEGSLMTELKDAGRFGRPLVSETAVTEGNWHHVGLTWDGTTRVLYVDDVEVARDTQAGLGGSVGGLHIGAGSNLAADSFWSGLVDDVRIYDRAIVP